MIQVKGEIFVANSLTNNDSVISDATNIVTTVKLAP